MGDHPAELCKNWVIVRKPFIYCAKIFWGEMHMYKSISEMKAIMNVPTYLSESIEGN